MPRNDFEACAHTAQGLDEHERLTCKPRKAYSSVVTRSSVPLKVGIEIPLGVQPQVLPQSWNEQRLALVSNPEETDSLAYERDLAQVPAVEVVTTVALHLMSAAAIKCGLGQGPAATQEKDLDEARTLINALAGLIMAAAPHLGSFHAGPLRDGLKSLQLAFREASPFPDEPGQGPGESLTGPVY